MSVREEDRRKQSNSSRGLGLATAAIGLGVGAALYYFLSKGSQNQENEGASGSQWNFQRENVLLMEETNDSDSYSTISEGTTSDTSVHDRTYEFIYVNDEANNTESDNDSSNSTSNSDSNNTSESNKSTQSESDSMELESDHNLTQSDSSTSEYCTESESQSTESDEESSGTESYYESDDMESDSAETDDYAESDDSEEQSTHAESDNSEERSDISESDASLSNEDMDIEDSSFVENATNSASLETGYTSLQHTGNSEDSDAMDWDITNTSIGIPSEDRSLSVLTFIGSLTSMISPGKTRERPWTLEECSICFDVMLRDQEIMSLPCTHNFHAQCLMPWLQEKQTCPNCRKHAD